jgi:hypothetical protein
LSRERAVQRYLERHVEYRARIAAEQAQSAMGDQRYAQAVVVPLFDEPVDCLGRVFQNLQHSESLVIAVVNSPDRASAQATARTRRLLHDAAAATSLDVLVIDCVSQPLSAKSAVGEARKIGTDVALLMHGEGRIKSPWLYQTDADAQLPESYFSAPLPGRGAVVFGHCHCSNDAKVQQAADLYDRHMAYYTAGLKAAGSPFAFPTLGSTITIHAHSYAAVRGYPKRNAAEDFYLLNKVAKIHGVRHQPNTVIQVDARLSRRVPFGTGPALQTIVDGLRDDPSGDFYHSYHPGGFLLLGAALALLKQLAQAGPQQVPVLWGGISDAQTARAAELLESLRFDRVRATIAAQYDDPEQRLRALNEWFDAGKTLRFIHQARTYHPDQPLLATLEQLPEEIARHLTLRT